VNLCIYLYINHNILGTPAEYFDIIYLLIYCFMMALLLPAKYFDIIYLLIYCFMMALLLPAKYLLILYIYVAYKFIHKY